MEWDFLQKEFNFLVKEETVFEVIQVNLFLGRFKNSSSQYDKFF